MAFGLPWTAAKPAVESKYPGGAWDADDAGRARYCAKSRQTLLRDRYLQATGLPPAYRN